MNRVVNPPELPKPSGFSHAVVAGNTVYLAGQVGEGETLVDQFDGAAANLLTALRAAGGDAGDLVSLQVFVVDVPAYRAALSEIGKAWQRQKSSWNFLPTAATATQTAIMLGAVPSSAPEYEFVGVASDTTS